MSSLNQANLIGNLGGDPTVTTMQSGDSMARFSLATSERWKDRESGGDREKTQWHRIVVFGKLADVVSKWLRKGDKVFVQGKLQTRKWEDDQGVERWTTEVVLSGFGSQMIMLGKSGRQSEDEPEQPERRRKPARKAAPAKEARTQRATAAATVDDDGETVPF